MERRSFLVAPLSFFFAAQTDAQPAIGAETEQQFYERHEKLLFIKASEPPYGLPSNTRFITKTDLTRIENELTASFKKSRGAAAATPAGQQALQDLIRRRSEGFILHLLTQAGLVRDKIDNLPPSYQRQIDTQFQKWLRSIVGNVKNLEFMALPQKDGGALVIADDGKRPDSEFIKNILMLDPTALGALSRMNYISQDVNMHEWWHVKGLKEGGADKGAAIMHLKNAPEERGAIMMWRDVRAVMPFVGDMHSAVTSYANCYDSLSEVLDAPPESFKNMTIEEIERKALEGAPSRDPKDLTPEEIEKITPKNLIPQIARTKPFWEMRISVLNAYMAIRPDLRVEEIKISDQTKLEALDLALKYMDAPQIEGESAALEKAFILLGKKHKPLPDNAAFIDPRILHQAMEKTLKLYTRENAPAQNQMIERAIGALKRLQDPVNAYGLQPNFSPPRAPAPGSLRMPAPQ